MGALTVGRRTFDCDLAYGNNSDGRCSWCGAELTGRRTRWCSDEHTMAFVQNHCWSDARDAAVKRDQRRCVRCGTGEQWDEGWWWRQFLETLRPRPTFVRWNNYVGFMGLPDAWRCPHPESRTWGDHWILLHMTEVVGFTEECARETLDLWRKWNAARVEPWIAADRLYERELLQRRLEVNHREPVLGKHAQAGCHHHLDGLETLCHRCHLVVTAEQRAAGSFLPT